MTIKNIIIKNTALNTFIWLLWRDVRALRKTFINQWLDFSFLLCTVVILNTYFMPFMGVSKSFGVLMLTSQIAASLAWVITGDAGVWAYDLQGSKSILYELTLPITYRLVYLKYACAFAIKSVSINLATLPIGILLVFKVIDFGAISPIKFLGAYLLSAVVFAFFNLFVVVLYKNVESYNRFWMRWGMIIWMFSGLFTPWAVMKKASTLAGYFLLLNPFLYIYESAHAAFMGQPGFINFWTCILAMLVFSVLFMLFGMKLFKKKLDCV